MMKKLLYILALFLLVSTAYAEGPRIGKHRAGPVTIQAGGQSYYRTYGIEPASLIGWYSQSNKRSKAATDTWEDLRTWESDTPHDMAQATAGSQPGVVEGWSGYRDFDGVADYLYQKIYEDNTGATDYYVSLVDGSAMFQMPGVSLSGYAGTAGSSTPKVLRLIDSADKEIYGFMADAGGGLATGVTLVTDGEFDDETGGTPDNWTAGNAILTQADSSSDPGTDSTSAGAVTKECLKSVDDGANSEAYQTILAMTQGKAYVLTGLVYNPTANAGIYGVNIRIGAAAHGQTVMPEVIYGQSNSWQTIEVYFTALATEAAPVLTLMGEVNNGDITYYDAIVVKEVTDVATTGVDIVSTNGGSTQNWAYKDSAFDPNDVATVQIVDSAFHAILTAFTVSMWVNPDDGQLGSDRYLVSQWESVDGYRKITIKLGGDGKITVLVSLDGSGAGTGTETTDAVVFSDGAQAAYTHVAVVYNGTTVVIYISGAAVASTTGGGGIPASLHTSPSLFVVGALSTPASYFAGLMDNIHIHNIALTAAQIQHIYEVEKGNPH